MPSEDNSTNPEGQNRNGASPGLPERQSLVSRVKALAEVLEGSDVAELDLEEDGARVYIKRQLEPTVIVAHPQITPGRARADRRPRGESAAPAAPAPEPGVAVVAPLTGIFYTASSPSSPPFAQVGETVQAGQVVCIIEAMKVFNEIKSEVAGTVTTIVAQNGQLVQKGEALIRVKPI
jgi:acetyl-CoA carboxylase biotin carboxyl carrier protein